MGSEFANNSAALHFFFPSLIGWLIAPFGCEWIYCYICMWAIYGRSPWENGLASGESEFAY